MASHVVRRSRRVGVAASLLVVLAAPLPAWAQRESGPFANLFGVPAGEQGATGTSLQLRGSLFGAWDDVVVNPDARDLIDRRFLDSRTGGGGSARLNFRRNSTARRFGAEGGSEVRFYPDAAALAAVDHRANAAFDTELGRNVTVGLRANGSYSSFYVFAPFLEDSVTGLGSVFPQFAFAAAAEPNTRIGGDGGLTVRTTRRSSILTNARWSEWRFLERPEYTLDGRSATGTFQYELTRALGVRAGYGYEEARYHFSPRQRFIIRTIDVGVDYRDTLAFARRTAVSFGSSTVAASIEDETYVRLNGHVRVTRGFRRTWITYAAFTRDFGFLAGFVDPVLSDSVQMGVGGLVHRRIGLKAGAAYSRGAIGFDSPDTFSTYGATTRVEAGLIRHLGVYGQYTYYHYDVPRGSGAAQRVPHFARQAASAGLVVWVPIMSDLRNPRDTR